MSRTVTIVIPGRPPTPNVAVRFGNWQQRNRTVGQWRDAAIAAADAALEPVADGWKPIARASLRVTFVLPDRRARDMDNLVASSKCLTDGLVRAGVLAGDSIHHIVRAEYGWRYEPGVSATEYTIEEDAA